MRVGIDVLDIARVESIYNDKAILNRIFGADELKHLRTGDLSNLAGLYCVKEAFFKAIGIGILLNRLKDVQVTHDKLGAPSLVIPVDLKEKYKIKSSAISISHTASTAVAVCILD